MTNQLLKVTCTYSYLCTHYTSLPTLGYNIQNYLCVVYVLGMYVVGISTEYFHFQLHMYVFTYLGIPITILAEM